GGSGASSIGISNNDANNYFLWAGHGTPASAPFSVKRDGSVKATKIQHEMPYTFWDMADGSTPAEFPVYIPAGYTIDSVTFTFQTKKARTFAKSAASGGSSIVTSAGIKEGTSAKTGMNSDVQTGDWGPATVTSSAGGTGATGGINNAPVATGGSGALTTDAAGTGVTGTPSSNSTSSNGSHTHTNTNHRHKETGNYTEYFQTAAQSAGAHTHTLDNHTHTGPSHTHGLASHTHTVGTHTHNGPSHTHDLAVPKHSHLVGGHNHTLGAHSHDVTISAHSHGINYGINEKATLATSCALKVGATTIGTYSPNPSNPVEIKAHMSAGWNTVIVAPNNDARIVAFALVKLTPA
ncbi:MAG TPA: hypothetical protein GX005_09965, partial [Bacteroidales bacterium]|nr:hypothetical protein [Bacteroidales bacterium]